MKMRTGASVGWLLLVVAQVQAQGDFAMLDPDVAAVAEDSAFNPYDENARGVDRAAFGQFDFDPSEGLTFDVAGQSRVCFYQETKDEDDEVGGAYVVSSADSHVDFEVKNPERATIYRRVGDVEGHYLVKPKRAGVYELCFSNPDADRKVVTHVTKTLQSQHPVEKEHVSGLAKYASHLDVRLGELESEQRLQLIRTDRHILVEEKMNKRVVFYGALECAIYLLVCFFQVYYIKGLLDNPHKAQSWV